MKCIKNKCQLMERCYGHRGGVRGWRGLMVIREVFGGMRIKVRQLTRRVTVIGEM